MKTSERILGTLFLPYAGLADDPIHELCWMISHDDENIKASVSRYIVPEFQKFDLPSQHLLKATLAYYLQDPSFDFQDFWDGLLPPFEAPQPSKTLMVWTWEALFPGETWADNRSDNVEDPKLSSDVLHYRPCASAQGAAMWRGYSALHEGRANEALEEFNKAEVAMEPAPALAAEIAFAKARCLEELQKTTEAIEGYRQLTVNFPWSNYSFQAQEKLKNFEKRTGS